MTDVEPLRGLLETVAEHVNEPTAAAVRAAAGPELDTETAREALESLGFVTDSEVQWMANDIASRVDPGLPEAIQADVAALGADPSLECLAKLVSHVLESLLVTE
ncbi:hypothetical protein VMT65_11740 [Nocardia sp. CDC153]|uniref:hypothetical protein n=1 Tax=Nocardia sp. CDC153 TaxID=3112167 RepID=UPI002DBEC0EA|nr:hypothetical protein [Nocardia sp. CDC153]MEC3953707.1 hypothetical protein [Nocardia sp. CDC153]